MRNLYGTTGIAFEILHVSLQRNAIKESGQDVSSIEENALNINVLCRLCNQIQVPLLRQIGSHFTERNVWICLLELLIRI